MGIKSQNLLLKEITSYPNEKTKKKKAIIKIRGFGMFNVHQFKDLLLLMLC